MLDQEARHGDDFGRCVHPRLRLLQCEDGMPRRVDPLEPAHVAEAAAKLGLEHIVITSVDRDDLPDGGASQFVKVINELRKTRRVRRSRS
jgi:lipoate synthase